MVAWAEGAYASTGATGIRFARVAKDATILTPPEGVGWTGPPPASTYSTFWFPVIASKPPGAAIVWLNNTEVIGSEKNLLAMSIFGF